MEITKFLMESLALIAASGVAGVFAYARGLAARLNDVERNQAVQAALSEDKHETMDTLLKATATHEQRLAIIETVITDLKALPALLREMVAASMGMKTLLEQHTNRVERLEDRVYAAPKA